MEVEHAQSRSFAKPEDRLIRSDQPVDLAAHVLFFVAISLEKNVQLSLITEAHNNRNPRWTQKLCIPRCLHSIFGSDYYLNSLP